MKGKFNPWSNICTCNISYTLKVSVPSLNDILIVEYYFFYPIHKSNPMILLVSYCPRRGAFLNLYKFLGFSGFSKSQECLWQAWYICLSSHLLLKTMYRINSLFYSGFMEDGMYPAQDFHTPFGLLLDHFEPLSDNRQTDALSISYVWTIPLPDNYLKTIILKPDLLGTCIFPSFISY